MSDGRDEPARLIDANGYARRYVGGEWLYEHRWVWEREVGPIPAGYHVHHANHDREDNRLENLRLIEGREHTRRHTTLRHRLGLLNNRGSNSPRYREDLDDGRIISLRDAGHSFREIGRRFGVHHSTISNHYRRALDGEGNL